MPDGPNYDDITIEKIAIQDYAHCTVDYPENPQVELTLNNPVEHLNISNPKEVSKILKFKHLTLLGLCQSGLYFMYIKQVGIPAIETPCCCNKDVTIAVAVNRFPIYNKILKLLGNDYCHNTQEQQLDIYLHSLAFYAAVDMQDYLQAINIYANMMSADIDAGKCYNNCGECGSGSLPNTNIQGKPAYSRGCGCHGK